MAARTATQTVVKTATDSPITPVFSLKDVAAHNTPSDCWVIVHGLVYDVSEFVPRHPGGNMIYVKAGGDCSQLFDSYHPLRAGCASTVHGVLQLLASTVMPPAGR